MISIAALLVRHALKCKGEITDKVARPMYKFVIDQIKKLPGVSDVCRLGYEEIGTQYHVYGESTKPSLICIYRFLKENKDCDKFLSDFMTHMHIVHLYTPKFWRLANPPKDENIFEENESEFDSNSHVFKRTQPDSGYYPLPMTNKRRKLNNNGVYIFIYYFYIRAIKIIYVI